MMWQCSETNASLCVAAVIHRTTCSYLCGVKFFVRAINGRQFFILDPFGNFIMTTKRSFPIFFMPEACGVAFNIEDHATDSMIMKLISIYRVKI